MTTSGSVEVVKKPKPWARAKVSDDVWCWYRGEPVARPAKITRIDMETGKAYLFVYHDGVPSTCIAREAPHRSEYEPGGRSSTWDFTNA